MRERKNGNFHENLKIPKSFAFYGTRENLEFSQNRFALGESFLALDRSVEKGCQPEQPPSDKLSTFKRIVA